MRINQFVAQASGLSRRQADTAIQDARVMVNGQRAKTGQQVNPSDVVTLDGEVVRLTVHTTIMLNKPVGYVCSRDGQGSKTIYELLPPELHHLKPIGRLDKDSSGLLLLTSDGQLAYELTHPSQQKEKNYEVELDKPLTEADFQTITGSGVDIGDERLSRLDLAKSTWQKAKGEGIHWRVALSEGRNRQIRRTFETLGYKVTKLHRTHLGPYHLELLALGQYRSI